MSVIAVLISPVDNLFSTTSTTRKATFPVDGLLQPLDAQLYRKFAYPLSLLNVIVDEFQMLHASNRDFVGDRNRLAFVS